MSKLMKYKDYVGSVDFDEDDLIFYGKLEFIKALVSYEATDAKSLVKAFHEAVDDYLALCDKEELMPEKPFKGSFNVRTGQELHRQTAVAAKLLHLSLNQYVCEALKVMLKKQKLNYR